MASYAFDIFKQDIWYGEHNLSAVDSYCLALVVSASAFISAASNMADITDTWDILSATWDISNSATYESLGYTPKIISGCTVSADVTTDKAKLSFDVITWTDCTIDADGCVIYKIDNNAMVCAIDFGEKKSAVNGSFTIQCPSTGIITLT